MKSLGTFQFDEETWRQTGRVKEEWAEVKAEMRAEMKRQRELKDCENPSAKVLTATVIGG